MHRLRHIVFMVSVLMLISQTNAKGTDRTAESVFGFQCEVVNKADLAGMYPGLKLPAKQYLVMKQLADQRAYLEAPFDDGDLILKVDGKAVSDLNELQAVLDKLELPCDVKIEYLDVTKGFKPKTKRESVTVKAKMPSPSRKGSDNTGGQGAREEIRPVVEVEYDKFKARTSIAVTQQELIKRKYAPTDFEVSLTASFDGKSWVDRPSTRLIIRSLDRSWRFLDLSDKSLYLVIDGGAPLEVKNPYYNSDVMDAGPLICWEYFDWTLTPEVISKLRVANKVECKIGIVEFDIPPGFGKLLADLERRIDRLEHFEADDDQKATDQK